MRIIPRRRKLTLMVFCVFVLIVYISFSLLSQDGKCSDEKCVLTTKTSIVQEYQPTCSLPKLDPFDKSILHIIKNYSQYANMHCPSMPKVFELVKQKIRVRDDSLMRNVLKKSVKYETVERSEGDDQGVTYGNEVFIFKGDKIRRLRSDFVKVSYRMADRHRRVEMFSQIVRKKNLEVRQANVDRLNVILMGFDSTSTANFKRSLPACYHYLVEKLQAFVFNGYSVIGDGTTPALTALLTGNKLSSVQKNLTYIDDWPWIMKDYKRQGYVTMYAEDDPQLSSFGGKTRFDGFNKEPADHYMRPFWLALEQGGRVGHNGSKADLLHRMCLNGEPLHNMTLNYMMKFLKAYGDMPKFAFSYFSYLPHGTGEKLSFAEKDLLLFLRTYAQYRESSILIIFGDHGARVGPVRNTIIGSYEEHLPWLSIVVPPWFHEKYPEVVRNLKNNQNIITSPFDVHHTLHHILNLEKSPTGTSLFAPLNFQRTCRDAGVDEHYCPCINWQRTDINSTSVRAAANMLVQSINQLIARKSLFIHLCFTIYLAEIILATKADVWGSSDSNGDSNFSYLQVIVSTNPGGARFQGTFYVNSDSKLVISTHISRTNIYGRKPWCLPRKYRTMRKFCTCKESPPSKRSSTRQ